VANSDASLKLYEFTEEQMGCKGWFSLWTFGSL